jgi:hypothetical protein
MLTSTNDSIRARIAALDLEPIKFKLVASGAFTEPQVQNLDKWYRRFFFLSVTHPDQAIVVSEALDEFWHAHILDTRKYAADCSAIFGGFLHHFPYFGLRGEEDERALREAYRATLELMRCEYGEIPDGDPDLTARGEDCDAPSLCSDCAAYISHGDSTKSRFDDQRPRLSV